ncbi:MAG: methyltransferase domain-containing protein, partial [Candidatus Bipolaricaulota bacterium]
MTSRGIDSVRRLYAETYDASVGDWQGEIDFYSQLAREASGNGHPVLELACGTGRVAIRLAQQGVHVVGLDVCPEMLRVAKRKARGIADVRWVRRDMRSFELQERFGVILIPGHSFQNLLTPEDQASCLSA